VPAPVLPQSQECEHPTGATLFGAIGIVAFQIAGCANTAVVDGCDPEVPALPHDFRGEVHLIMRETNAGTELDNEI
jgi:hypothetical protein